MHGCGWAIAGPTDAERHLLFRTSFITSSIRSRSKLGPLSREEICFLDLLVIAYFPGTQLWHDEAPDALRLSLSAPGAPAASIMRALCRSPSAFH